MQRTRKVKPRKTNVVKHIGAKDTNMQHVYCDSIYSTQVRGNYLFRYFRYV